MKRRASALSDFLGNSGASLSKGLILVIGFYSITMVVRAPAPLAIRSTLMLSAEETITRSQDRFVRQVVNVLSGA